MKINLIQNYFISGRDVRDREYLECLTRNVENNHIDNIYLFCEKGVEVPINSSKIQVMEGDDIPTYEDYFTFCNDKLQGEICIIANLDIYYDDTLKRVERKLANNTVIALGRWQVCEGGAVTAPNRNDMQDSWMFKSPIQHDTIYADFTLGRAGCDNRIAYELSTKYSVINPALTIKAMHLHLSGHRVMSTNDPKTRISKPYKLLAITK